MLTFSIITVPVSPQLEKIHNEKMRIFLILDNENAEAWLLPDLTQDEMADLMVPFPDDSKLDSFRVMDQVLNTRVDTNIPEVIQPMKN